MRSLTHDSYSDESRLIAALCYLFLLVMPVLVLVSDLRRQRFLRYHGYQGLAVGVVLLLLYVLVIPLAIWVFLHIPCIGWTFACAAPFIYLGGFGLQLYWAYLAYQGRIFSIPVVGDVVSSSLRD